MEGIAIHLHCYVRSHLCETLALPSGLGVEQMTAIASVQTGKQCPGVPWTGGTYPLRSPLNQALSMGVA